MPKISAFTILSEPERLCYPYIESIKSFLPLCDEIIVVYNILPEFQDGSLEKLQSLDSKVKVISGLFDYKRLGWASQGIMRTNGYYACTGDIVLMFDADGIFHEKDINKTREELSRIVLDGVYWGFWMKHHFYSKTHCWRQCKHSGIYNKKIMGNKFNFYGHKGYYAPNWELFPKEKGRQLDTYIYGYEHLWETEEILRKKLEDSIVMQKSVHPDFMDYDEFRKTFDQRRLEKMCYQIPVTEQPKIIQEKLNSITKEMYGFEV
jgi:hypothetical protein